MGVTCSLARLGLSDARSSQKLTGIKFASYRDERACRTSAAILPRLCRWKHFNTHMCSHTRTHAHYTRTAAQEARAHFHFRTLTVRHGRARQGTAGQSRARTKHYTTHKLRLLPSGYTGLHSWEYFLGTQTYPAWGLFARVHLLCLSQAFILDWKCLDEPRQCEAKRGWNIDVDVAVARIHLQRARGSTRFAGESGFPCCCRINARAETNVEHDRTVERERAHVKALANESSFLSAHLSDKLLRYRNRLWPSAHWNRHAWKVKQQAVH